MLENNDDITPINLEQILFFKSRGIAVLNSLKWCELFLHRIPPYLINNKYQIIDKFDFFDNSFKVKSKKFRDFFIRKPCTFNKVPYLYILLYLYILRIRGLFFYSQIRTGFKGKKSGFINFKYSYRCGRRYEFKVLQRR